MFFKGLLDGRGFSFLQATPARKRIWIWFFVGSWTYWFFIDLDWFFDWILDLVGFSMMLDRGFSQILALLVFRGLETQRNTFWVNDAIAG